MQYDEFYEKKVNPIEKFENISNIFKKFWSEHIEEDGTLMRLTSLKLRNFLECFEHQQGSSEEILPLDELKVKSNKIFILNLRLLE